MLDIFHPVRDDFIARVKKESDGKVQGKNDGIVRRAQPKDAPAIHEVMKRAFKGLEGRGYPQRAIETAILSVEAIQGRIAQDGAHALVALTENPIAGTASGMGEHEGLHVCSVAVDPAYQGRGIACRLMEELENLARRSGCHKLFLQTAWSMTEAIMLYRNLGYQQ
jgi:ribosomal protein S18 acetylase RimI-like enzyme